MCIVTVYYSQHSSRQGRAAHHLTAQIDSSIHRSISPAVAVVDTPACSAAAVHMLSAILYPPSAAGNFLSTTSSESVAVDCRQRFTSSCFGLLQAQAAVYGGNRSAMSSQQASPVGAFRPPRIRVSFIFT